MGRQGSGTWRTEEVKEEKKKMASMNNRTVNKENKGSEKKRKRPSKSEIERGLTVRDKAHEKEVKNETQRKTKTKGVKKEESDRKRRTRKQKC